MKRIGPALVLIAMFACAPLAAQTSAPPLPARSAGDQDLPKVLYIVPWKDSGIGERPPRPRPQIDDAVLAPVDRDTFRLRLGHQPSGSAPAGIP